jgi:hypothetical protein
MTYTEIENLAAEAFLNPDNFVTAYDKMHDAEKRQAKYNKGLEYSNTHARITINYKGVWSASNPGSLTSSCEGIGYHAITCELLLGFLDGTAQIIIMRWIEDRKEMVKFEVSENRKSVRPLIN